MLLASASVCAQGVPVYDFAAFNAGGTMQVLPSASLRLCREQGQPKISGCTPLAPVYSLPDLSSQSPSANGCPTATTQPGWTADSNGNVCGFVPAGYYRLEVSLGSQVYIKTGLVLNPTLKNFDTIIYADQYCSTPGTLDDSCLTNALGMAAAGSTIIVPGGVYSFAATPVAGLSNSGDQIICQGNGNPPSGPFGTTFQWTGPLGGTVFQVKGARKLKMSGCVFDLNAVADEGLDVTATATSATYKDDFTNLYFKNAHAGSSCGGGSCDIHVGSSLNYQVSNIDFTDVWVDGPATSGVYQEGTQTEVKYRDFQTQATSGAATNMFNLRQGWATIENSNGGDEAVMVRANPAILQLKMDYLEWEGSGTKQMFLMEDGIGLLPTVRLLNSRAICEGTAGTKVVQWGATSTGAAGNFYLENNEFDTLNTGNSCTVSFQGNNGSAATFINEGNYFANSPDTVSLSVAGATVSRVDIDSPSPWTNLNNLPAIAVSGYNKGISVGGVTLNPSPAFTWTTSFQTLTGTPYSNNIWAPDQAITVTRMQATGINTVTGCGTAAVLQISNGTSTESLTLSNGSNTWDTGAIAVNFVVSTPITASLNTAASGCSAPPQQVNLTVQYKMQ